MEQNSFANKYVNVKNLMRLLGALWVLAFLMPMVKITASVFGISVNASMSGFDMVRGISLFGEYAEGEPANLVFFIIPAVFLVMWVLLDIAQIAEKIVVIVGMVCSVLGFVIQVIYALYLNSEMEEALYGMASIRYGIGYWLPILMEICTFILALFMLMNKLNANVIINKYNWNVFTNSFKVQPAEQQMVQPEVQAVQPEVQAQTVEAQTAEAVSEVQPEKTEQPAEEAVQFCNNCGNKIVVGQKFCTNCGTKLA